MRSKRSSHFIEGRPCGYGHCLADHEQKNRGPFTSVEQATAARTATWIVEALNLADRAPHLISVIEVIADWIIVLGTTMIWGPTSTMDLSELYFLFDDATTQANMPTHQTKHSSIFWV